MTILRLIIISLCLWGYSLAQPLANYAPADSILTLSWSSQDKVFDSLKTELEALNWPQAMTSIEKILKVLSVTGDLYELQDLLSAADGADQMMAEVIGFCPAFEPLLDDFSAFEGQVVPFKSLLSVSVSAFNPIPAITALLELDEGYSELMVESRSVLLDCLQADMGVPLTMLEQDGVPLYVVDDGGDFPVILGNVETLFFISSNPEIARKVVRLAQGGNETSLADTEFYQKSSAQLSSQSTGFGFSLNLAALADTLESFTGFIPDEPELRYLTERGLSMLRTLGGASGQLSVTAEGLLSESLLAINPDGGDEALLKLALCESCTVSSPLLAPETAIATSSQYIAWRELWTYIQDWATGVGNVSGQRINLKEIVQDEFGFDLDATLFNWLGSELHTFVLEPLSRDLRTIIYNPAQVSIMPVSSPEAARQGISTLIDNFGMLILQLISMDSDTDLFGSELDSILITQNYRYNEVDITRYRFGPSTDFGYALVGNYLVVGTPAAAIEAIIDTYQGGRTVLSSPSYQSARANSPQEISAFAYSDDTAQLRGLADILDVLSQPVAFLLNTGLRAAYEDWLYWSNYSWDDWDYQEDWDYDWEDTPAYADIAGMFATPLSAPMVGEASFVTEGELLDTNLDNLGYYTRFYELEGLEPGTFATVLLDSDDFETYLRVINAAAETYVEPYIEYPESGSQVTFEVEDSRYWLEVSSFSGEALGVFQLSITVSAEYDIPDSMEGGKAELEGMTATLIEVPGELRDELGENDLDNLGYYSKFYELSGLNPGDSVNITVSSEDFSPSLWLIDAEGSMYIDLWDTTEDAGSYSLRFIASEDMNYWLEVSSYFGEDLGSYSLSISIGEASDDFGMDSWSTRDLSGVTATFITPEESPLMAELSATEGNISKFYELSVTEDTGMTISLNSSNFDAYLYLIDADTGLVLDSNDDYLGTDSQIGYMLSAGQRYLIEVTSFSGMDTGSYTLTLTPGEISDINMDDVFGIWDDEWDAWDTSGMTLTDEDLPSFAELFELLDLLPQGLRILADHLSISEGYSTTDQDSSSIISRYLIRIRW